MVVKQDIDEAVVCLGKSLDVSNSFELKKNVQQLMEKGYRRITLDFSQSCMVDASGLGKILMLQRKISAQQGELRIINASNKHIQRIFELVQLKKVVNID